MFLSIKRIIAITLIVAITVTSAGTSTLASSVQNVTATAKTNYEKQETIDYRFYEAFKYQRRTSLLLNGDSQEPKLSGEVDKKNGDGDGATKTGADSEKETTTGSPAFSQKKDEENKETTIVESENDDKTTVDKSLATNSETTGDENDDEKTTINANEEEPEEDENVATSSDTEEDESGEKSNKTENEKDEEETVATSSDAEEENKDEATPSDTEKISIKNLLNIPKATANDTEGKLFGIAFHILPNTWFDESLAGVSKDQVGSIVIVQNLGGFYSVLPPATYDYDYEIPSSEGVHVYVEVAGYTDPKVTIYVPSDEALCAHSDCGDMFSGFGRIKNLDLTLLDTSMVNYMNNMFRDCHDLETLDLSSFDTSNVTNMEYMFSGCSYLDGPLDLSNFDTSNVTNMKEMFYGCYDLETLDLSSFDTSNVTDMERMFYGCSSLRTIMASNRFFTGSVGSDRDMFESCNMLEGGNGTKWSERSGSSASDKTYARIDRDYQMGYFTAAGDTTTPFGYYVLPNDWWYSCGGIDKSRVRGIDIIDFDSYGYYDPSSYYYSMVNEISGSNGLHVLIHEDSLGSGPCDVNIFLPENRRIYASDYTSNMFSGFQALEYINLSILDTRRVTDMSNMFNDCPALTSLDLSSFNTSNVTDMSNMFNNCQALTSLDLNSFNTSNVTNMTGMFNGCQALTTIIASTSFVTTSLTAGNDANMFDNCSALVGGNGTSYLNRYAIDTTTAVDKTYAKIDRVGDPGYFSTGTHYTLPNTWYNETSAGASKVNVQSITISKYPNPAPTTYTHHYTIPGSNGLYVYANVTALGTGVSSAVIIYAPKNKTIYAAEDSSSLFRNFGRITNLDLNMIDTSNVTNMGGMFSNCQALTSLNLNSFNTSNVTDMSDMFSWCLNLPYLDLRSFVTASVSNMGNMFSECHTLGGIDFGSFNTSNVTDMYYMFSECRALNNLDVSGFNTSKVTNMMSMFDGCSELDSLDLSNFDTSMVTNMRFMFNNCHELTSLDVRRFNTSNVTEMDGMFKGCEILTDLDLSGFDTEKVTGMNGMFESCQALTTIIASTSFVTTSLTAGNDVDMFTNCSVLEGGNGTSHVNRSAIDTTTADNSTYAWIDGRHAIDGYFTGLGSGSGSGTDGDGTNIHSIRVKASPSTIDYEVNDHFNPAGLVLEVQWTDGYKSDVIYNSTTERDFTFNPATTSELQLTDTNVVITYAGVYANLPINITAGGIAPMPTEYVLPKTWFDEAEAGTGKNIVRSITISKYPTPAPAPTTYTHHYTIPGSNGLYVYANVTGSGTTRRSNVTIYAPENKTIYAAEDSSDLFRDFKKITDLDLTNINTSNVTNMSHMFYFCQALRNLNVSGFDTSNVTNMSDMFFYCQDLNNLNVGGFDTSNVTDMSGMFKLCSGLSSLVVSSFSTIKVTDMNNMFSECQDLTSLDLSNFDTSNVTDMNNMFSGCSNLENLDVSSFSTIKVTDMNNMFNSCSALHNLDLSSFNTSNVTDMNNMFNNCSALENLDVSSFDTSKVTSMDGMFSDCSALNSLDVSNFNTSNVIHMYGMFSDCSDLISLDLSNFDTSNVTDMSRMFYGCQALTTIIASTSFVTTSLTAGNDADMFANCSALEGGNGTRWFDRYTADQTTAIDKTYAKIDKVGQMGYFTAASASPDPAHDPITVEVESITITKNPKLEYIIGQVFDPSGLVISAKYNDGTITPNIKYNENRGDFTFDVSLEDPLDRLGNIVVTVTYKGVQKSFNINVRDWNADENVSSIKITRKPQTQYTVDDTLNLDNLEIEVTYTDARSNRNVTYKNNETMFIVTPSTTKKLQITDKTVTVTFGGKEDKFDIVVDEVPVNEDISDMRIIKPPTLVNYIEGQKLDPSGLVIEVTYNTGTKKQITYDEYANKFSLSKDKALTLTDENVTVTFGGKTDTFEMTIIEAVDLDKDVFSIKINKVLGKVNYIVGEKLNPSDLVLEVTYSNNLLTKLLGNNIKAGKTFLIDYNTYSNLFSFVPGITQSLNTNNKIVTLTFGGKQLTFNINVNKVSNSYGPSNGGGGGGGGGGGRLSGGLPVTEMNTVIETVILSSDYEWIYNEEGQRDGVKLKKESALAKALMSSDDYKANYKDIGEEGYIQIQNGFYNLQCGGVSFFFGFSPVGKMLTGFVKTKDDTEHYWVDETTYTLTAIGKPGSAKYYLYNENGDYRGIIWSLPITIGNTLYTFDVSGRVLTETYVPNNDVVALSTTGWDYNPIDDSWKYYNTDSMGNRYYIKDEVKEITDNGVSHYYIFGEDEKMKTGLTEYKGKTYYLVENGDYKGAVYTGMLPLGGKVLTFDEQGVLVSDEKEVKALTTTQQ